MNPQAFQDQASLLHKLESVECFSICSHGQHTLMSTPDQENYPLTSPKIVGDKIPSGALQTEPAVFFCLSLYPRHSLFVLTSKKQNQHIIP